jgi:HNH endonuclease
MNYKLSYDFDAELNCGIIRFDDKQVLMDFTDLFSIINFEKNFIYYLPNEKPYPYYLRHNQKITYLEHMFKYDYSNVKYKFKNENMYDLRRDNIIIHHIYHDNIISKYNIIDYNLGHYSEYGKDAYVIKNPMWKVKENEKEFWLMFCEKDTICMICDNSLQKILEYENNFYNGQKLTWFKSNNGYIQTHISSTQLLYIHQIIKECYGNGKGTKNVSIDHIDRNPLNNTFENLRVATREEQEQNSKGIMDGTKRARKTSAIELPDGITQEMMPKYVYYAKEYRNPEKTKVREFFRIEKHPKLDKKCWATSKAYGVSIQDKLKEAINKIKELDAM